MSDASEDTAITIRLAASDDADALATLAQLDSAAVPAAPVLMAEAGGRALAAISLCDGSTIADPFHRTAAILELLAARAGHLRGVERPRGRSVRRWLGRPIGRAGRDPRVTTC